MKRTFNDQELIRRKKLEELKQNGEDPFLITKINRTDDSSSFKKKYNDFSKEELHTKSETCVLAGRVVGLRQMFALLQDQNGQVQIYMNKNNLNSEQVNKWKKIDLGDWVSVEGSPMKTNTGELTVNVNSFTLISKSLKVLPEKWHGLVDEEERARRRYVDLIVSSESKKTFLTRTRILLLIRKYMDSKGYVEVETPILQSILGGAAAKPFITHHNALDMKFYLRIATELHLKRCIVGGIEKVYEIGRIFRNEGMDSTHNPEFTTIEAYAAFQNIDDMMILAEEVIKFICKDLDLEKVTYNGNEVNLIHKFSKVHMVDLINKFSGVNFWKIHDLSEAKKLAKQHDIHLEKHHNSIGHIINLFFEKYGEKNCIQPTFVFGHPVEISPLAKRDAKDPRFTERFELFISGKEFANAFSELNDPIDQYERFEQQLAQKDLGNEEANEMDVDFVEALEYGMPPTGGIGIGVDRLVMLLTEKTTIRDVLLFPHMRNKPHN